MTALSVLSTTISPRLMLLRKYMVDYPDVGNILGKPSVEVTEFNDDLRQLIVDMFNTMRHNNGVGLAANQIGLWLRVAVIDIGDGLDPASRIVLVNPTLIESSGSQIDWEGCLSIPGFRERVKRPMTCRVRAQNENGDEFEITGEGLLARVLMHEIDHCDAKVYLDRVSNLRRMMVREKIGKLKRRGQW